jgi:hypothetical protein
MSNNKQIEKPLELPHQETIVGINTIQTKPFDNQKEMSNNKQSMKLYTEDQVKKIQQAILCNHKDAIMDENYCLNVTTPIELPSDEGIKKIMELDDMEFDEFDPYHVSHLDGAKWMRDKIQGGNK